MKIEKYLKETNISQSMPSKLRASWYTFSKAVTEFRKDLKDAGLERDADVFYIRVQEAITDALLKVKG